jgi:hypothetical protein
VDRRAAWATRRGEHPADELESSFTPGIINLADRDSSMDRWIRFSAPTRTWPGGSRTARNLSRSRPPDAHRRLGTGPAARIGQHARQGRRDAGDKTRPACRTPSPGWSASPTARTARRARTTTIRYSPPCSPRRVPGPRDRRPVRRKMAGETASST